MAKKQLKGVGDEIPIITDESMLREKIHVIRGQDGGTRYLPYAFTEQGIYMLVTVLRGARQD